MKRKLQQLFCPNLQRCSSGLLAIGRAGPSIRRYSDEASSTAADETTKKPIRAGVMLSRPAILTEEPTAFEKAFFLYQRRMNERLALPFTRYFYLKKGTNAFVRWKWSLARRKTVARDIGVYDAYGKSAWNDEALVGAPESEPSHQVGALIADSDSFSTESGTGGPAAARSPTELAARLATGYADADERSLRRALRRTVTLMIQNEKGHWVLPTADLVERETLRQVRALFPQPATVATVRLARC